MSQCHKKISELKTKHYGKRKKTNKKHQKNNVQEEYNITCVIL